MKISDIGSIWVTTTRPFGSVGWMMLPTSTCRTPVMPEIGDVSLVYSSWTCACSISASSDLTAFCSCATCAFWVSSSCGVCVSLAFQLRVAIEVGKRICQLGLIAIARGGHLIELRLIGAGIDLGEQIAGVDRSDLR